MRLSNPKAVFRAPLTMEDYLSSRMISSPFRLFDCDVPVDGSTALVVSAVEHVRDLDHPAARVDAVGTALRGRPSWELWDDLTTMAARTTAEHMWSRTDLRPSDVDVAELYDGFFSWLAMSWLEALGFCGHGESGSFIEGGQRIALGGEGPRHGGQLSGGRVPTATAICTRRSCSCAARRVTARCRGVPRWRWSPTAAVRSRVARRRTGVREEHTGHFRLPRAPTSQRVVVRRAWRGPAR